MDKKGFTLIELLSVVTLIVLISIIVLPNVLVNINSKKGELSEVNMKLLSDASDVYIDSHSGMYANTFEASGSVYCIPIQSLINDGVLEGPIRDVNGEEIDYSDVLRATYDSIYNGFSYEKVSSSSCTELVNYISRPELSNNMIPVVYADGSWRKADVNSKWYNYLNKEWANAVVVREYKSEDSNSHSRYEYLDAPAGTVINSDDILGYFVWIPRFRYQLFDSSSLISINVVFESVSSTKSNGTVTGQWLTHPAFTYNGNELSGVWVGKYEASNSNDNVLLKSGLTPWTDINYNSANEVSINMLGENNIYGLSGINSHMTRNSEWSAVSYLASSIYGINGSIGSSSSTTGNNTGIYNMVGNKEFVILDAGSVTDLGQSLSETASWTSNTNSFKDGNNLYITRGGSSIFNYDKATLNNSSTSFRVSLINKVVSSDYKPKYIVNFDANGGSVSTTSKEVSYGDPYGELPTPTRDGYTFMGWNGKNMINVDAMVNASLINNNDGTYTMWKNGAGRFSEWYYINIPKNKNFCIQSEYLEYNGTYFLPLQIHYLFDDGTTKTSSANGCIKMNKDIIKLRIYQDNSQSVGTYTKLKNLQFEFEYPATPYEPYYVTSSVLVTQDKNHTLKAIWEANS